MMKDLTSGSPVRVLLAFSLPMIAGNLFQQLYNVVDTIVVGRYVGTNALAAVGSSFSVMVFLTSILLGLCMGSSVVFAQFFGAKNETDLRAAIFTSFGFIGGISVAICILPLLGVEAIVRFMRAPPEVYGDMVIYLRIIFIGILFTFLYNWSAGLLRALGDSRAPLWFLIAAALLNLVLDILFVVGFGWGVAGAAAATVLSQFVSAALCFSYCVKKLGPLLNWQTRPRFEKRIFRLTASYSLLTCAQQSIMNFGILLVQGLVNSFGAATMAAFAAVTKIDAFAYSPVQEFGNAFATYVAQNSGAKEYGRVRAGIGGAVRFILLFCAAVSLLVLLFARPLLLLFIHADETEVIGLGVGYLRIVTPFYFLIGFLFMLYGLYRGIGAVRMSIVLTVLSLGTRVALAYLSAPLVGLAGIWWAIPAGWLLADLIGFLCFRKIESATHRE